MLSHLNGSERDVMGELQWEACMNISLEGWDGSVEVLLSKANSEGTSVNGRSADRNRKYICGLSRIFH